MIAVEEGVIALDDAAGQPGCTFRHLLAHAGGYAVRRHASRSASPVDAGSTRTPASRWRRRAIEHAAGLPFATYLDGSGARAARHGRKRAPRIARPRLDVDGPRPDPAARRAPASDADLRRRCCGMRHGPVSRPRGYRSRRGEVRSVPVGAGHRDPRGQDAALDRHGERAIHVRALRWCRHDDVGRPGGRMRAGGPRRPPVRRLAGRASSPGAR